MRRRTLTGAVLAGAIAPLLALTACGGGGDPLAEETTDATGAPGAVTVGSANFPESELLAEMYAQVLEGEGVQVERSFNIGAREVYLRALQDGSIDLLPEYNGALLAALSPDGVPEDVSSPEDVYDALQDVLPDGTETLEQAAAEDKDTLTVTRETAEQYSLTSIADLAPVAGDLTAGGGPEFQERYQGLVGLEQVYGVTFGEYRPLDAGGPLTVQALSDGTIQVANLFSTDSAIETNDFVPLEDPENLFLAQNIVPLIRSEVNDESITEALNAFSATLTTENLTEYLARVQVDRETPGAVATAYLTDNGLA
ncbi:ABC transporter substrate-binding protein [Kineococcus terrestris]|uniref:ABC transporter substrate-binding protein n=1 Tax=Kineococcus terrestris TaxID=2044856 RepID=UPI0034DAE998